VQQRLHIEQLVLFQDGLDADQELSEIVPLAFEAGARRGPSAGR
jgi:hypothetical protein